jgi:hypothetical protein
LYAIGVFLSFTLSQTGMARRWWKIGHLAPEQVIQERGSTIRYERGWQTKMVINGVGAVCTAIVMIIFAATKFLDGAWIVVVLTPTLVFIFFRIHHHYKNLAADLSLENHPTKTPISTRHRVILTISGVHQGTLKALHYARTLSDDVTAVHVSMDPAEAERIKDKWDVWGEGVRLVILDSPYRLLFEPLLGYIEMLTNQGSPNELITIVVPQFVPRHWWHNLLHTQAALMLWHCSPAGVTVTDVLPGTLSQCWDAPAFNAVHESSIAKFDLEPSRASPLSIQATTFIRFGVTGSG